MNLHPFNPSVSWASRRSGGVALVATLIMLSLVTFMVVAFLGVARRERRQMETVTNMDASRSANEAARSRAVAEVMARLLATGDKYNYGVMVSTNFQSPNFTNNGVVNPYNVNHTNAILMGGWLQNLASLQFDPRLPVFSPYYNNVTPYDVQASETNQGRWYLDLNRNGLFDYTDSQQAGDPQWVGILQNYDQPHGALNQGAGRYAYLVVPAGKTLDQNWIHNQAKLPASATQDGYYRNLGVGPQEMNLAAVLAEANPYWTFTYDTTPAGDSAAVAPTARNSFRDARDLLLYRNNFGYNNLATLNAAFGAAPAARLVAGQFDVLSAGPLMISSNLPSYNQSAALAWAGGSNTSTLAQRYYDINELFLPGRPYSATFTPNLLYVGTNDLTPTPVGERSRHTFYSLLSTLGTESWPVNGKLNLNWSNTLAGASNSIQIGSSGGELSGFTSWAPSNFFIYAAELMIRASCTPVVTYNSNFNTTNWLVTNWFFGQNYANAYYTNTVPPTTVNFFWPNLGLPGVVATNYGFAVPLNAGILLSITNIPLHPLSYYSGEMHRILQLAANIYDATTSNNASPAYPSVFRPTFSFNTNGWPSNDYVYISGYTTNNTDANGLPYNLLNLPKFDLSDPNSRLAMYTNALAVVAATGLGTHPTCLLAGTPVIIGAKRGYPNFNEFAAQSLVSVTRRLEYVKAITTNVVPPGPLAPTGAVPLLQTNQSLILSLFNINAIEAWNSYSGSFPPPNRTFVLVATNISRLTITNQLGVVYTNLFTNGTNIVINAGTWPGATNNASFKSFLFTNVPMLSTGAYAGGVNFYFPTTNVFVPALGKGLPGFLYSTNYAPLPGLVNGGFMSPASPGLSPFGRSNGFPEMQLGLLITNSVTYALFEPASNRVVDFVTLTNLISTLDISAALSSTNGNPDEDASDRLRRFFIPARIGASNNFSPTIGISNQFYQSTNIDIYYVQTNLDEWTGFQGSLMPSVVQVRREIERFRRFMGLPADPSFPANQIQGSGASIQLPYTASRIVGLSTSWEANDPLVHYTTRDLESPFVTPQAARLWRKPVRPIIASPPPPGTIYSPGYQPTADNYPAGRSVTPPLFGLNRSYSPWGRAPYAGILPFLLPSYPFVAPPAYDQRLKDAGIYGSDAWDFPQRKFANLGWLGRVHRGTPWQTVYLKSDVPNPTNWLYWAHSADTNPTNDWRLMDVFSAAINADATRSLLSVNQTNSLAWAAALGGVQVLQNQGNTIANVYISPQTLQLTNLVGGLTNGIINAKQRIPSWQPMLNYSLGDLVSYQSNFFGNPMYPVTVYYRSLANPNQNQNPLAAASTFWTPLRSWTSVNYPVGSMVERYGLCYYSLLATGNTPPENTRLDWTPEPINVTDWNAATSYNPGQFVYYQGMTYYALATSIGSQPDISPANWAACSAARSFTKVGSILSTPELSVQSPYLSGGAPWQYGTAYAAGARVYWQGWYYVATQPVQPNLPPDHRIDYGARRPNGQPAYNFTQFYWWPLEPSINSTYMPDCINDDFIERIPQQTLGLLQLETSPRAKIYAWGQALRPADRGIYVGGGPYQGMVTNYQITGESATLTVVRIDGLPEPGFLPRPIPAGAPPQVLPRVVVESHKQLPVSY